MNTATRSYDLRLVGATPWTPTAPARDEAFDRRRLRRLAATACLFAGLVSFATCMVALRLSLFPQSVVSSRAAVLTTLVVGAFGVAAFFAAHRLHETPALPPVR